MLRFLPVCQSLFFSMIFLLPPAQAAWTYQGLVVSASTGRVYASEASSEERAKRGAEQKCFHYDAGPCFFCPVSDHAADHSARFCRPRAHVCPIANNFALVVGKKDDRYVSFSSCQLGLEEAIAEAQAACAQAGVEGCRVF